MDAWIDVNLGGARRRVPLSGSRLRVGGPGCDVEVPDCGGDELQLWSDPAKVVRVGDATIPLLNGRVFEEGLLGDGDTIQWCGAVLVYGTRPVLQELAPEPPPRAVGVLAPEGSASAAQAPPAAGDRGARRVAAGLLVDLGLAPKATARRWQEAVLRNEFDPDACAREILAESGVGAEDPRVLERSARLQRDLLMMPFQRGVKGAGRRARQAAKGGSAFLLVQLLAVTVYTLLLFTLAVLAYVKLGWRYDAMLEGFLEAMPFG